jgi:hypothetical protein
VPFHPKVQHCLHHGGLDAEAMPICHKFWWLDTAKGLLDGVK